MPTPASFQLGVEPLGVAVILSPDADFVSTLQTSDSSDWPDGVSIELRFDDSDATVWAATVDGDEARWSVDKDDVNALRGRGPSQVRLFYVDGDVDILWARGSVI